MIHHQMFQLLRFSFGLFLCALMLIIFCFTKETHSWDGDTKPDSSRTFIYLLIVFI